MKIEYYPDYLCGIKLFLDPSTLDGIMLSDEDVSLISFLSVDDIPKHIPQTPEPEGTLQTPAYFLLDVKKSLWKRFYESAFLGDFNTAKEKCNAFETLVNDKTPKLYRESNHQYENRVIMKL